LNVAFKKAFESLRAHGSFHGLNAFDGASGIVNGTVDGIVHGQKE
jgi:hypothetical protein